MTQNDTSQRQDVADCYRICRNFQDYGAKIVWKQLREHFKDKSDDEIASLIIEVGKIV